MHIPWTAVDAAVATTLGLRALGEYLLAYHLAPWRLRTLSASGGTGCERVRDYWLERRRQVIEGGTVLRNALVAAAFLALLCWRLIRG